MKNNPKLKLCIQIFVSIGLLTLFLHLSGIQSTLEQLSRANLWYIPVGVAIYLLSQLISAHRWRILARPLGFSVPLREFYQYYLLGMFFNLFLPGTISGDVGRMYLLARRQARDLSEALLTLLAERGSGLFTLLLLTGLVCLLPAAGPIPMWIRNLMVGLAAAGLVGVFALLWLPLERLGERYPIPKIAIQAKVYLNSVGLLLRAMGLCLLVHLCMFLIHLLIARALSLGDSVSALYLLAVYGIVTLLSVLPISFNGIGVREGAYLFLLKQVGISSSIGLAFGLYWLAISTLTSLLGGLVLSKLNYRSLLPEVKIACSGIKCSLVTPAKQQRAS